MKKSILYIIILLVIILSSCEQDDPKVDHSSAYPIAGEWGVTYTVETSPGVFEDQNGGYSKLSIFNTASDKGDSVWIDDNGHFWTFKTKAAIKASEKTFATTGSKDIKANINVTINKGQVFLDKIITKGAKTKTDSIYMELEFEDDPGTIYHCSGVRRTGYLEDDAYYGF